MTVPCGLDSKGLPIGMQLIGDCFKEKDIIRAGYAFECTRKYEMLNWQRYLIKEE